jgi:C4-dicarboxylate-specific signal transduction histidine kinase
VTSDAQQKLVQTERLASMGQLSAGVAHEINNPLGTVLIYSHMLLRRIQQDDPAREDLQMIVSEATRCKTIVRGLLDFARQSRVSKEPTELQPIVKDVVTVMTPRAKEAGVVLAMSVPDRLPSVMRMAIR